MGRGGRGDEECLQLVRAATAFLEDQARLQRTTSYTELNTVLGQRTQVRPFDFDRQDERAAMGSLLGDVTADTFSKIAALGSGHLP